MKIFALGPLCTRPAAASQPAVIGSTMPFCSTKSGMLILTTAECHPKRGIEPWAAGCWTFFVVVGCLVVWLFGCFSVVGVCFLLRPSCRLFFSATSFRARRASWVQDLHGHSPVHPNLGLDVCSHRKCCLRLCYAFSLESRQFGEDHPKRPPVVMGKKWSAPISL